jgi:hypothetical protein
MTLRRRRYLPVAVLAVLAVTAPAWAQAPGEIPAGVTSSNLEHLAHFPDSVGVAEGGRLVGSTFYTTSNAQGLFIFDTSVPERPRRVGALFVPHAAENEDVTTNGRILLLSQLGDLYHLGDEQTGTTLNVIDVHDPSDPRIVARLDGGGDHTWECLLDCTWAYGASGLIADLRDPARPRLLETTWKDGAHGGEGIEGAEEGVPFSHDVTEVAPGIVMTASNPMFMLDAREDPARPRILAVSERGGDNGHNVVWPRGGRDRFLVTATESLAPGRCDTSRNAALAVYDASEWETRRTFVKRSRWRPSDGTYLDGSPPVSATWYGCSSHWAEVHPTFRDGGLVAGAFYSHGTILLEVDGEGQATRVGTFLPHGGSSSAVYWITDRILYVVDLDRGLDVLRYTGPLPERGEPSPPAAAQRPARRCRSARLGVRAPRGHRLVRATVYVDGRRTRVVRGARTARRLALRRPAAGRARVRVVGVTDRGRRVVRTATVRACRRA